MSVIVLEKPIPVVTEHGEGYILYIETMGVFENDIYTVVLCNGGLVKHYNSGQVKVYHNATFGITKKEEK